MVVQPSVLVLSNTNTKPKSLIKLITKSTSAAIDEGDESKYCWAIDSKYYSAEVILVGIENDFDRTKEFNSNVEGVLIHFDANKESGLKDLKIWDSIQSDCDPEVKILLANYCNEETKITRTKAVEWCLKKGFEFIELYPFKSDSVDEGETDIGEKVGVERVIEALHSHTWSNMNLKLQPSMHTIQDKNLENITAHGQDNLDSQVDTLDDFTELFSQLHMMRESLSSLPPNQRKQCAEQMVTAFWKAIGGDEDELSDL